MILVDSSVWIAHLRGSLTPTTAKLEAAVTREPVLVGDLILLEVLQGARDERAAARIERGSRRFEVAALLDADLASHAARHHYRHVLHSNTAARCCTTTARRSGRSRGAAEDLPLIPAGHALMNYPVVGLVFVGFFASLASAESLGPQIDGISAFAGQHIAVGWAAESCRGDELSQSEREACNALGVAGKAEDPMRSDEWLPIFLKCPDHKDDGALISIDENLRGQARRIIVNYRAGTAASVEVATANVNSNFGKDVTFNFDTETQIDALEYATYLARGVTPLNNKICNADSRDAKARYDQVAKANENELHKEAPDILHEAVPGRIQ